jgi:hypothetical protein
MPDNPNRSHPAGISRREALRGVLLGSLGLALSIRPAESKTVTSQPVPEADFVPENTYPTFADEPTYAAKGPDQTL